MSNYTFNQKNVEKYTLSKFYGGLLGVPWEDKEKKKYTMSKEQFPQKKTQQEGRWERQAVKIRSSSSSFFIEWT